MSRVIVLGSGVIGLNCALQLAESSYNVTIIARDFPSDVDAPADLFASPWAGADWHSFLTDRSDDKRQCDWETTTFNKVWKDLIPMGLAMKLECVEYYDNPPAQFWYKDLCPDYRELIPADIPSNSGFKYGITYSTWSVDPPRYIRWFEMQLKEKHGVEFVHATADSIGDVFDLAKVSSANEEIVVVNATGLGARTLGGVADPAVHPIAGQIVVVWAPHFKRTTVHMSAAVSVSSSDATLSSRASHTIRRKGLRLSRIVS